MKKYFYLIVFFLLLPVLSANAQSSEIIVLNQISVPNYSYARTFDNLALDFVINAEASDTLNYLTVHNLGTAKNNQEIERVALWQDNGNDKFDGFGIDTEIAVGVANGNSYWYFGPMNFPMNIGSYHFFVSYDLRKGGTLRRSIQFSIPRYEDVNGNHSFDIGDSGIFFSSQIVSPADNVTNEAISYYNTNSGDIFPPKVVVILPVDQSVYSGHSLLIQGRSRDQGQGGIDHLDLCINNNCQKVTVTSDNFDHWAYQWNDIVDGTYQIKAKSFDPSGNTGESAIISVTFKNEAVADTSGGVPPTSFKKRWIKTVDNSAVYYLDDKRIRHAYPLFNIWQSYFENDFSFVEKVSSQELSTYPLGRNVLFRAGTLIKLSSSPKVYKVGTGGIIRWIATAEKAVEIYGSDWYKKVFILPDSLWPDYRIGDNIE